MGFSLKKLGRGIKKIAKKNKGGFGRLVKKVGPGLVLGAVTGGVGAGIIAKAASTAKTLGKKAKGIETPKSLVPVVRAASISARRRIRSKMPGGAPMPTISRPSVGMMATREKPRAAASLYKTAKKAKAKKAKRTSSKPPSAAQLAAREKFKAMVAAKRKAKAA